MTTTPKTQAWCAARNHPWVTYNLWLDRTWCRCGERQADGEQPIDLDAAMQEESPERLRQLERYVLGKLTTTDDPRVVADETEYLARIRQALEMTAADTVRNNTKEPT